MSARRAGGFQKADGAAAGTNRLDRAYGSGVWRRAVWAEWSHATKEQIGLASGQGIVT